MEPSVLYRKNTGKKTVARRFTQNVYG